jgi:hypothetical protein
MGDRHAATLRPIVVAMSLVLGLPAMARADDGPGCLPDYTPGTSISLARSGAQVTFTLHVVDPDRWLYPWRFALTRVSADESTTLLSDQSFALSLATRSEQGWGCLMDYCAPRAQCSTAPGSCRDCDGDGTAECPGSCGVTVLADFDIGVACLPAGVHTYAIAGSLAGTWGGYDYSFGAQAEVEVPPEDAVSCPEDAGVPARDAAPVSVDAGPGPQRDAGPPPPRDAGAAGAVDAAPRFGFCTFGGSPAAPLTLALLAVGGAALLVSRRRSRPR